MVKKTRIAILWESFPNYLVQGIRTLAVNYDVEIFAACHRNDTTKSAKAGLLSIRNIKVIDFTHYSGGKSKESQAIKKILDFNPDLAIITARKFSILSRIARILKNKNIPVVGADDKYWHNSWRDFANLLLSKTGYFQRHFDLFWVPGLWGREYVLRMGFKDSQIIEGVYTADTDLFNEAYKKRSSNRDRPKVFLFVGQYIKRKGLDNLLAAYQIYCRDNKDPWQLWCVGRGELKFMLKNRPGVKDFGFKNPTEISQIMSKAGCFVLPSRIDHWGVVIHEACCAGLPILASTACGAAVDLIKPNFNGFLFSANDIQGLSELMQRISKEKKIEYFGKNSYSLSKKYSPELWADKIMEEIPNALNVKQINKRVDRISALANISSYDTKTSKEYIDGAPHLKHVLLRKLYNRLVVQVVDFAAQHSKTPKVLDLGAGEGSATLPFLELGAKVVAVDISRPQINALRDKCQRFNNMLEIRHEDVNTTLRNKNEKYDVIIANSFLHHVPDYIGMIKEAIVHLKPYGQLFFFQDPLRYDTVGKFTELFGGLAYFSWRIFKGDVAGGLKRRLRRSRGIYFKDSVQDNAEYHVVRNGVDQNAICKLLKDQDIDCDIIMYFSTQSSFFQIIGNAFGLKNTFGVIARKRK